MVKIYSKRLELADNEIVRGSNIFHNKVSPLVTTTKINPQEYALIIQEGEQADYAMNMNQGFNGKNHLDTNVEVLSSGLAVPRAKRFFTHLDNVNQALAGKGVLYDADGNLIEGKRLSKYAYKINHDCWVRLGESFKPGEGHLDLQVVTVTGLENERPVFKQEPLQECLSEDCYADLESLNEQGFPLKKSPVQEYEPGKSVYFVFPRPDSAVGFLAYPDDADFDCGRLPLYSYPGLGVRHVREAHAKK